MKTIQDIDQLIDALNRRGVRFHGVGSLVVNQTLWCNLHDEILRRGFAYPLELKFCRNDSSLIIRKDTQNTTITKVYDYSR